MARAKPDSIRSLCRAAGIENTTYYRRIQSGWSHDRALSTPPRQRNRLTYNPATEERKMWEVMRSWPR